MRPYTLAVRRGGRAGMRWPAFRLCAITLTLGAAVSATGCAAGEPESQPAIQADDETGVQAPYFTPLPCATRRT